MKAIKTWAVVALLCLLGAFAGYLPYEFKVRSELWNTYAGNATPLMVINQSLGYWAPVDDFYGRKSKLGPGILKISETFTTTFVVDGEVAFSARVHTNNLGFLSDKTYSLSRPPPPEEIRIYVAGDSITGTTTMNGQWVDLVEDLLNANSELRAAVGGKVFRTYNGGVPGADFKFFWDHYQKAGSKFDPDLIIVNYIESDFPRMGKPGTAAHTDDEALMIQHAATFTRKFVELGKPTIFTNFPLFQDLFPQLADFHLSKQLKAAVPGMKQVFMHERLPWKDRQSEVRRWYNLPYDGHMSLLGGQIYAAEIAKLIAKHFTGRADFDFASPPRPNTSAPAVNAKDVFSPTNRNANLLEDGLFKKWMLPAEQNVELTGPGGQAAPGWSIIADGEKGLARLRVSRYKAHDRGLTDLPPDAATLMIETLHGSTAGVPSLQTNILKWKKFAGRKVNIAFRLRSSENYNNSEIMLVLTANYGSGPNVSPLRSLFVDKFQLNPTWRDVVIPLTLPSADYKQFGQPDTEGLAIQFMATATGQPFNFEIADAIAAIDGTEVASAAKTVLVGDRELPVGPFVQLREEINRRYRDARRSSFRPFGYYRLRGLEPPFGYLPAGMDYVSGFVPLTLNTSPPEQVVLNVYCTRGKVSLENSDCYHAYQVYAR